jgi:transcription initiation factor TFIIB
LQSCGRVAESHIIDERSEWRTFGDKDKDTTDPTRVGGPVNPLLSDGGLSTMITVDRGGDRGLAANLNRLQERMESSTDRALVSAFRDIGRICTAMKLPDIVRHQANEYFKEAHEKSKSVRSRSHHAVVAAVVFLACRQTGYSRTFKEICAFVPEARVKDIGKMYKAIVADLKLKESGQLRSEVAAVHPEQFLRRFMSMLGFNHQDMKNAVSLANAMLPQEGAPAGAEAHDLWHGRSPLTIAGTIMYIIASLPNTSVHPVLEDICAVSGVAEPTIKGLHREMQPYLQALIKAAGAFATPEEIEARGRPPVEQQQQQQV